MVVLLAAIAPQLLSEYRGASLIRKRNPLGPYSMPMPGILGGTQGVGRFLMGEVPLYGTYTTVTARVWPWISAKCP